MFFHQSSSSEGGGGGIPAAHGALPSIIDTDPMTTGTVVVKTEDPLMAHPQAVYNLTHEIPCPEDTAHLMKAATSTAFAGDFHCHHQPEGIAAAKDYAQDVKVGPALFD